MVFDGCQPLVQLYDGNDASIQSSWDFRPTSLTQNKLGLCFVNNLLDKQSMAWLVDCPTQL